MDISKSLIVIIEGPSGVGKDSVMNELIRLYPNTYQKIVSMCSRPQRENETQNVTYCFVTEKEFKDKVASGEIFEYTTRHGSYRGMSKKLIDNILRAEKIALKDCDSIGIAALKATYPNVFTIFLKADRDEIVKRLIARGDNDEERRKRLLDFDKAIKQERHFDVSVTNNNLKETVSLIHKTICAEQKRLTSR